MIKIVNEFETTKKNNEPVLQAKLEQATRGCHPRAVKITFHDEQGRKYSPVMFEVQENFSDSKGYHLRFWVRNEKRSEHTLFTYPLPYVPTF